LICWDQWFPEGARLTAMAGAEILFYPTAIGWHPSEKAEYGDGPARLVGVDAALPRGRQRLLRGAPNRIGHEHDLGHQKAKPVNPDGIEFWGQSFVSAPNGKILASGFGGSGSRFWWSPVTSTWSSSLGPTGRSCATGASTPTAASPNGFWAMAKLKRPAKTPKALGYSFPPEWAPHRGTWLSWPRPEGISFPDRYHTILPNLAEIVRQIGKRERVEINVPNGNWERLVQVVLREHRVPLDAVHFHRIKTNECWCRDHGPAFVLKPRARQTAGGGGRLGVQRLGRQVPALRRR
jgi:hypothetical protein